METDDFKYFFLNNVGRKNTKFTVKEKDIFSKKKGETNVQFVLTFEKRYKIWNISQIHTGNINLL